MRLFKLDTQNPTVPFQPHRSRLAHKNVGGFLHVSQLDGDGQNHVVHSNLLHCCCASLNVALALRLYPTAQQDQSKFQIVIQSF
jgi:hypothetical protein